jgi:uncharacterized membrane protein
MTPNDAHTAPTLRQASGKAMWRALRRLLRTRLVAGILTVVPIWITYAVVKFVFNVMRGATEPLIQWVTDLYATNPNNPIPEEFRGYLDYGVPVLAVLLTLFMLYLLGLFTANVAGRRVLGAMERLVDRVPIVKTVYRSTKQIVATLAGQTEVAVGRVVLIDFPRPGMKCVGFLTSVIKDQDTGRRLCTVFIPTTPNPTTGYMEIVPYEEVTETHWSVEDAARIMMSGGVLCPPEVPFEKRYPPQITPKLAASQPAGADGSSAGPATP